MFDSVLLEFCICDPLDLRGAGRGTEEEETGCVDFVIFAGNCWSIRVMNCIYFGRCSKKTEDFGYFDVGGCWRSSSGGNISGVTLSSFFTCVMSSYLNLSNHNWQMKYVSGVLARERETQQPKGGVCRSWVCQTGEKREVVTVREQGKRVEEWRMVATQIREKKWEETDCVVVNVYSLTHPLNCRALDSVTRSLCTMRTQTEAELRKNTTRGCVEEWEE